MNRTYELGMTLNYVSDWVFTDAVREFFQNCLDEELQHPEHKWFSFYDKDEKTLQIGNKHSSISPSSLLMGSSTKKDDIRTVGEHGEGYKVATIVLLRTGHTLKIYNYIKKEIWEAHVVKSKRYGTDIVKFEVNSFVFKHPLEDELIFEIGNVTEEEYNSVVDTNLWINENVGSCYRCEKGSVLLNESQSGRIYVNGLFVKTIKDIKYGYNFVPGIIKLDRDRHTLDSFDLVWCVSQLVSLLLPYEINKVKDAPECRHLVSYMNRSQNQEVVYNDSYEKFKLTYGEDTIPVLTDREFNEYAKAGYTCKKLSKNDYELVTRSPLYKEVELKVDKSMKELVEDLSAWVNSVMYMLPDERVIDIKKILKRMKERVSSDEKEKELD